MKNKISHKFLLSIITMSSLILLGACSNSSQKQASETKSTVESSKVNSSSSKVKSSTKDSSRNSGSGKLVKDSSNNASSNSNASQNNNEASSSVASNNSQPSSSQPASNLPSIQEQPIKDATPTAPIDSGISVSGSYQTTQQTPVKNSPSVNAPIEFYLDPGSNVNYDMKVTEDGHEWLSYISTSGIRRYVQADNNSVTTLVDSGTSVSGSYQTVQQTPVKNSPSVNAPIEFYLDPGSNVNYDMKVTEDGHEWLSYISSSGIRRYVQLN